MISLEAYFMGRDKQYPNLLDEELRMNAAETVRRATELLGQFGDPDRRITSGWRPPAVNVATPGAAPNSKHMTCQAIDISDPDGDLDEWLLVHADALTKLGLWQEHPSATKGWCHVQIVPPKSGNRVFYP